MQKTIKDIQAKISIFADERKWAETYQIYGILLNIIEETGEAWNIVKHLEKDEDLLKKVIKESNEELEDFIGVLPPFESSKSSQLVPNCENSCKHFAKRNREDCCMNPSVHRAC